MRRHPLRVVARLGRFFGIVAVALVDFLFHCGFGAKKNERALWLQRSSRRALRIFKFEARVSGPVPQSGLLVSNHLSYLDILTLASITPAVFVSRADVRRWPLFGWLAALAGTIFVERERRMSVGPVNREIQNALDDGALVAIFPEGTSSNGETVLPFRTSLLEPAAQGRSAISIAWLHYEIADGDARDEVCHWGGHTFVPHLIHLLGKKASM